LYSTKNLLQKKGQRAYHHKKSIKSISIKQIKIVFKIYKHIQFESNKFS